MNIDQELYEAAYVDGIKNRAQEIIYITVPSMKPQMLFGAVMSIVNAFNMGWIGVALAGANPTPEYSGQLIANHIDDFGKTTLITGKDCFPDNLNHNLTDHRRCVHCKGI